MRVVDGKIVYSPSDLVVYFQSPYVSWVQHHNLVVPKDQRILKAPDATAEFLSRKGDEFERQEFRRMTDAEPGLRVVEIARTTEPGFAATLKAMEEGVDLIYQGALKLGDFQGYTDFMKKVPGQASKLGDYSYEIFDTKLARRAKPTHALQINCYNEMLREILGDWPTRWHLILGTGETVSFLTSDFRYYYAHFKEKFLRFHAEFDLARPPVPDSWESVIGYEEHIATKLKSLDHLSTIAGMSAAQMQKLRQAGINTRAALATTEDADRPRQMQNSIFLRLREQAHLQIQSEEQGTLAHHILEHKQGEHFGLARLPEPDEGDVMFDMEGDPFTEGGLEYLFGVYFLEKGKWVYRDWRVEEEATGEKRAFQGFVEWILARVKKFPRLHVYHYANYEKAAIAALSNKYSSCVAEVDHLLRNEIFVDLYTVVKEGVRVGAMSYSIKKLEPLYHFRRESSVTNAGDSVVQFNTYSELKLSDPAAAAQIFAEIVEYNRDDVVSTLELLRWLREQKKLHGIAYAHPEEPEFELAEGKEWELVGTQLLTTPPTWIKTREDARVNAVVAGISGYFHREDRPVYWNFFNREDAQAEELYVDAECLAVATAKPLDSAKPRSPAKPNHFVLSFDPDQPLKLREGDRLCIHGQKNLNLQAEILNLDLVKGYAEVRFPSGFEPSREVTLIPGGPLRTSTQKEMLLTTAKRWQAEGARAFRPPARDLLYRRPARVIGITPGQELYPPDEKPLDAALRLALALDQSTLSIQGPPGTGKTFTGAHIICHLLRAGKRVGVVAQGKKTIENLLLAVTQRWSELQFPGPCPQILMADGNKGGENPRLEFRYVDNSTARKTQSQFALVGGTHWLFAHPETARQPFDYLFIDEAGQYSLSAAIACSFAAKNMILLGDQMQLEQVNVGVHTDGSGLSVLNYYMNGLNTIPRTHGVFLDETWRMHPAICDYISDLVYEKRLRSHIRTRDHVLEGAPKNAGLLFVEVDHDGNSMRSEEEATRITELIDELRRARVPGGTEFSGGEDDLILITPYNAQVELLRSKLPDVKVGSVDLFQGQEAWVSILSMCASGEDGLHRGLDFLLSKNRLNVGLSRAKALSIVVGSAKLLDIRPGKIATIPLLNFYAGLREHGLSVP